MTEASTGEVPLTIIIILHLLCLQFKKVALVQRAPAWECLYEEVQELPQLQELWNLMLWEWCWSHTTPSASITVPTLPAGIHDSLCHPLSHFLHPKFLARSWATTWLYMKSPEKRSLQRCTAGHVLPLKKATQAIISQVKLQHERG